MMNGLKIIFILFVSIILVELAGCYGSTCPGHSCVARKKKQHVNIYPSEESPYQTLYFPNPNLPYPGPPYPTARS